MPDDEEWHGVGFCNGQPVMDGTRTLIFFHNLTVNERRLVNYTKGDNLDWKRYDDQIVSDLTRRRGRSRQREKEFNCYERHGVGNEFRN